MGQSGVGAPHRRTAERGAAAHDRAALVAGRDVADVVGQRDGLAHALVPARRPDALRGEPPLALEVGAARRLRLGLAALVQEADEQRARADHVEARLGLPAQLGARALAQLEQHLLELDELERACAGVGPAVRAWAPQAGTSSWARLRE